MSLLAKDWDIPAPIIRDLYLQHLGSHIKCECCGKRESLDEEFARCSRCQTIPYCSRDCQKKHWKQHKTTCYEHSDEMTIAVDKLVRRLDRFSNLFAPMLSMLLVAKHGLYRMENKRATPRTHAMMVHVSDLPDDAKKPRLRIDKVEPCAISDLSDSNQNMLESALVSYPTNATVLPFFLVYDLPKGPFLRAVVTSFQDDQLANERMKDKKMVLIMLMSWIQTINSMAKGKRTDLWNILREISACRMR